MDPLKKHLVSPRILLVEDSQATRMLSVAILSRYGYEVDAVADGVDAVAAVESLPYDLVLMDVDMPGMDGITATAAIRALSGSQSKIPIIGISAHALGIMRNRCLQAGMNDYLTKPVDRRVLLECLARYFAVENNSADDVTHSNPASADARLDLRTLRKLACETSADSIGHIICIFIDELHGRVQAMRAALRGNDTKSLGAESHALKSSAATFGFVVIETLATKIDEAVRLGDLEKVAVLFSELEAEVAPSIDAVRNEFAQVQDVV
jgi:two-component system, sensor histidine kinase and response regulator